MSELKGGIYETRELYVYCDDPHGNCPLDGMQGTVDAWQVLASGGKREFIAYLRRHGWKIGKHHICPDCVEASLGEKT